LRFRLIRGRWIEPGDHGTAAPVVAINDALARRYFAGADPVGRYLDIWGKKRRIIGVVADVRDHPADAAAEPAFWMPLAQQSFPSLSVAVRTEGDPLTLVSAVRAAVDSVDRELPIAEIKTMDDVVAQAFAERRFARLLCEMFAVLAMALTAIGVYGMLSYLVEQRRREIGLRLALGSTRSAVIWMVVSSGILLAGFGIAAGLLIAPLAGRAVSSSESTLSSSSIKSADSVLALAPSRSNNSQAMPSESRVSLKLR